MQEGQEFGDYEERGAEPRPRSHGSSMGLQAASGVGLGALGTALGPSRPLLYSYSASGWDAFICARARAWKIHSMETPTS